MDYRTSYDMMWGSGIVFLVLLVIFFVTSLLWIAVVGCGLFILGQLQAAIFFRCPQCRRSLFFCWRGSMLQPPEYCPQCGCKLGL